MITLEIVRKMHGVTEAAPHSRRLDYHAHHSPLGAYFSFTCGRLGRRGGLGAELGRAANQDLFVGCRRSIRTGDGPLRCLPFFAGAESDNAARYTVGQTFQDPNQPDAQPHLEAYARDELERHFGWGTDRWVTDDVELTVFTPAAPIPDPATTDRATLRSALLPAVVAELAIDNRDGTTVKTGFLAINFNQPGVRLLEASAGSPRAGFALRDEIGVLATAWDDATGAEVEPFLICRWTVDEGLRELVPHRLGSCPGVGLEVAPGQRATLRIACGVYLDRTVTTRLRGRYLYARYYDDLEDVLGAALGRFAELRDAAWARDRDLRGAQLSEDQQFLIAHATRSYCGNTQLLDIDGTPAWIVNEGEYAMMNTLDLSVDQVFWELDQNPWVVRNLLEWFTREYSYRDALGLSFVHDMGANNNFAPHGHSSYELPKLTGCFSYMTQEELCNWVLCAACYVARTGDRQWTEQHRTTLTAALASMVARTGEEPSAGGIMSRDSSRCEGGSEITTYDSLDPSLGQARNNLYLAVKCWATYLALELTLPGATRAFEHAQAVARTVVAQLLDDGWIPAVFEPESSGHRSRILPAVEGLVYPLYWSTCTAPGAERGAPGSWISPDGPFAELVAALRRHTLTLLGDPERRNLFPDGGLKLSSTADNSWFSKIALFQHVARHVLDLENEAGVAELLNRADAAHVDWQIAGGGDWACSDQFVRGKAEGSRYYPRCVTTWLWLQASQTAVRPHP